MTPDDMQEHFEQAVVFSVEGARVGFVTCKVCGASVLIDPRDVIDYPKLHIESHGRTP